MSDSAKTSAPDEISAQLETTNFGRRQRTGFQGLIATTIEVAGLMLFIAVMLATLLQVFARYAHIPIPWTEEFARTAFLASVMLGIALATYLREHIVVDFLFVRLSRRGQARLWIFFNVGILLLLIVWLRGAWRLFEINTDATFVTLPWLSVSWLYGIEAFSILLMILFVLADLFEQAGRVWDRP